MIKFRLILDGKIVGYEKWYPGEKHSIESDMTGWAAKPRWLYSFDNKAWGIIYIEHDHKEQFAGLHDKNGKDLDWWEGDIFARASDSQIEGTVIYDLGCFWLDRIRGGRTPLYECTDYQMYKIGNIHENGDLLNDTDEQTHTS